MLFDNDLVTILVTFLFCLRMARGGDTALIINYYRSITMMRAVWSTTLENSSTTAAVCSETAAAAVMKQFPSPSSTFVTLFTTDALTEFLFVQLLTP